VKIIIASGSATVHSQTLNTCGVNDILNKPFSAKELFSTIEKQFKSDNQPQK
jgi:FixJ family two-component response regulator